MLDFPKLLKFHGGGCWIPGFFLARALQVQAFVQSLLWVVIVPKMDPTYIFSLSLYPTGHL
jgi:hypothetical protein